MTRMPRRQMFGVHPPYRGGYTTEVQGYVFELCPEHPYRNGWGYVQQHRLVAEDEIGRLLRADEFVHHIDRNPLNNRPDNLQVVTRSEHMAIHAEERAAQMRSPITAESVQAALLKHGSLKKAAAELKVHTETLRNRYPDLIAPYKRKSPTLIDSAPVIELIRQLAPDSYHGYREIARQYGISYRTVQRICERNGIPWMKKTKKGEVHKQYRRKMPTPLA